MLAGLALLALTGLLPDDLPNVLVLVADDLGVDRVAAYGEHPEPGRTPVIDELAAQGVLFRNAWSQPVCSASRAAMLTGHNATRTGIGTTIRWEGDHRELATTERTLAQLLAATHHTAAVGKWHLTATNLTGPSHPQVLGFDHFRGNMGVWPETVGSHYYRHDRVVDGVVGASLTYSTTESVDDALALIDSFGDDPWFVWVAFNAPHTPIHRPPDDLHSYDAELPKNVADDIVRHGLAMIEAMDTEIGRLLASLDPAVRDATYVIFVGDNGTSTHLTTAPFPVAHAKPSVFEGGLNVPLIITGPDVEPGTECKALVTVTDLFATVLELGGSAIPAQSDAVSLVPYLTDPELPSLREAVYAELFLPNGTGPKRLWKRAARNERFKLIRIDEDELDSVAPGGTTMLFDLEHDPFEQDDLADDPPTPETTAARAELLAVMDAVESYVVVPQPGWTVLEYGLPGALGVPELRGTGAVLLGTYSTVTLTGGPPMTWALLAVGLGPRFSPFFSGVFAPQPDLVVLTVTDGAGGLIGPVGWPPDLPSGSAIWFQVWLPDDGAVEGIAGSNALVAVVP